MLIIGTSKDGWEARTAFCKPEPHGGIVLWCWDTRIAQATVRWAFRVYCGRGLGRWLSVYFNFLRSGWLFTHIFYSGRSAERLKTCAPTLSVPLRSKTLSGAQHPLNFLCFRALLHLYRQSRCGELIYLTQLTYLFLLKRQIGLRICADVRLEFRGKYV
jgi:hypothetical protein